MKKIKSMLQLCILAVMSAFTPAYADEIIVHQQWYDFSMSLKIPCIYDNNESLGYRKYERQTVRGKLSFDYSEDGHLIGMSFIDLINKTHRLQNGKNVTYKGQLDDSKTLSIVAIGDNKTQKFNTASICFSLKAEPNYNIGLFDEDTSLFVTLSGSGKIKNGQIKSANGTAAGTLGCGCYYYGHTSPTRVIWWYGVSDSVSDIASVHGTWRISQLK